MMFKQGKKTGFFERKIVPPLKSLGKYTLFAVLFMYPIGLVVIGIAFGWIVFWPTLLGSFAVIGILLTKLGYSRHFASWGHFSLKSLGAFILTFLIALSFYAGIFYLRAWLIPIIFGILGVVLTIGIWHKSR